LITELYLNTAQAKGQAQEGSPNKQTKKHTNKQTNKQSGVRGKKDNPRNRQKSKNQKTIKPGRMLRSAVQQYTLLG